MAASAPDGRYIQGKVAPVHQPAFFTTFASEGPSAIVRVREGTKVDVPDFRDD